MAEEARAFSAPEQEELDRKRAERVALEAELAQQELDLQTLRTEIAQFHVRYLRTVGVKFAELDDLEAEIAELSTPPRMAAGRVDDDHPEAEAARERARETKRQIHAAQAGPEPIGFTPSDDLKRLYRQLAKQVHPDLAVEEPERERRRFVMAEINEAYENADLDRLRELFRQWQVSPENVEGEGTGADLVRIIRQIAQIQERLRFLAQEVASLEQADLYRLKRKADEARADGRDLLMEMTEELKGQIEKARLRRDRLKEVSR